MRIGIIGLGTVGKAIKRGFEGHHEIFIHDPKLGTKLTDVTDNCDAAYIAVPTPTDDETGRCDTSIVRSVLEALPDGFSAIIKSTVIPGTSQDFHDEFPGLRIACSPEFIRAESANEDFKNQEILVVGTHHEDLANLVLKHHNDSGILLEGGFFHVGPTEAEIVKYAKNSFYAMKVIFGNHFQRRLAVKIGIAQVALYGITRKPQVLDQEGVVQPQLLANGFPLFGRDGHAHHFLKRVP